MISGNDYQEYYLNISSIITKVKNELSKNKDKLSSSLSNFISQRLDYFSYKYEFLRLPLVESEYFELLQLEEKICPSDTTSKDEIETKEDILQTESGFKVSYNYNGKTYTYQHCILVSVTYTQNKSLIEKCKEYSSKNPSSKKFFIYKKWLPDLKEHAIYCDDQQTLAEISDYVINQLGGSVRKL